MLAPILLLAVATVLESGIDYVVEVWWGVFAPAAMTGRAFAPAPDAATTLKEPK